MRTIVIHAPHDLRIDTAAEPGAPGPGQVLVRLGAGGICGSDLHYFHHGGFGAVRIKQPMILGHEVAGTITAVGAGVSRVKTGDRVAVNPSLACGRCVYCTAGDANHCVDMRFYGSAMRFPHVQGAFRQHLICTESQAVPVAAGVSLSAAAFAEPLAVCLHAVRQAGDLKGKRVLIAGAGPIGCLTLLAARHAGASEVVVTDIAPAPLAFAQLLGAHRTIDVAKAPMDLAAFGANKGTFDIAFEAAGNATALTAALETVRPKGTIVQIGLGGAETVVPLSLLVSKEITLRGTFRFHQEFEQAVAAINSGAIDVAPLLSATLPLADAREAFALASDRTRAMKVQIAFE
jgi:L-idonate 5-dehydrogenase